MGTLYTLARPRVNGKLGDTGNMGTDAAEAARPPRRAGGTDQRAGRIRMILGVSGEMSGIGAAFE
jgi:hypothetical protein